MRRLLAVVTVAGMVLLGLVAVGGPAAYATTPGQNGLIAFAADTGSGPQIFIVEPDGTGLRQLTHVSGEATSPDWSPDGQRIAFELDDETHAGIAIMNADGTNLQDLTPTGFRGQPAFTPDRHHLVFECGDCPGGDGVFIMNDDGTNPQRLTTNPFVEEGDANPEVSPDGGTVTFVRHQVNEELQALFAVDIDGTNERQLTSYALEVGIKHDWAPDGQRIVITPHADFPDRLSPNVATISADGSDLRMLTRYTEGAVGAFAGSYSPDGHWIVFRLQSRRQFGLWVMSPNGGNRRLIATFPFAPRFIDWGPQSSTTTR